MQLPSLFVDTTQANEMFNRIILANFSEYENKSFKSNLINIELIRNILKLYIFRRGGFGGQFFHGTIQCGHYSGE
jgi:hypothetical protein